MKLVPISVASGALMGPSGGWASADIATINRNVVRCRTMERIVAPWHVHADSDELFYVLSGQFHLETDEGTATVDAGELLVVPTVAVPFSFFKRRRPPRSTLFPYTTPFRSDIATI